MTVEYKANNFTIEELHQVLEYCYTGSLSFEKLQLLDILV